MNLKYVWLGDRSPDDEVLLRPVGQRRGRLIVNVLARVAQALGCVRHNGDLLQLHFERPRQRLHHFQCLIGKKEERRIETVLIQEFENVVLTCYPFL